jgi:hypothetical protein
MKKMKSLVWAIVAVFGISFSAAEDAFACRLGIGDRVWFDANGNGIQDDGEPGINGVRVTISPGFYANMLDPNSFVTSVITATSAAGDGYYLFRPVDCNVDYTIGVDMSTVPDGLAPTAIRIGSDNAVDSDDPAGTVVNLPVTGFDYSNLTIDFGFTAPACTGVIGNRVWHDANNNGIQDAGEGNYAGAVVTLTPGGSLGTDANGLYSFTGLCGGTYQVCVATPPNSNPSPANQGSNDEIDSDGIAGPNGVCTTVNLPNNTVDNSNDFGFNIPETPSGGTGTPGYWMNHPEAWPLDVIVIGGRSYAKGLAIELMGIGQSGDKTYTMFSHLVATKLNLLIGTEASCIAGTVGLADEWMAAYPVGSRVKGSSLAWKNGEPLAVQLDRYNNGMLCAPARD